MSEDQPKPGKKKVVKKVVRKKIVKKASSGGSVAPQPGLSLNKNAEGEAPLSLDGGQPSPSPQQAESKPSDTAGTTDSGLLKVPTNPVEDSDYSKLEPWADSPKSEVGGDTAQGEEKYVIKGADGPSMFDAVVYGQAGQAASQQAAQPASAPQTPTQQPAPSQPRTPSSGGSGFAAKPVTAAPASSGPSNPLDDAIGDAYDEDIPRSTPPQQFQQQAMAQAPVQQQPAQSLSASDMGMGDENMDDLVQANQEAGPAKKKSKFAKTLFHMMWLILSFGTTWGAVAYFQFKPEIPGVEGLLAYWVNPGTIVIVLMAFWFLMMLFRFRWVMMFLFLLLSPFTVSLGMGVADYFMGKGMMRTVSQPDYGALLEVNPGSRTLWTTEDVLFPKNMHAFSYFAYNQGLSLTGSALGPMQGTYNGPLPSHEEVREMLHFMDPAPFGRRDLRRSELDIDGESIKLTEDAGYRMIDLADEVINEKLEGRVDEEGNKVKPAGFKLILSKLYREPGALDSQEPALLVAFLEGREVGEADYAYVALIDSKRGDWLRVYEIAYRRLSAEGVVALDNPFLTDEENQQRQADRIKATKQAEERIQVIAEEESKGQETDEQVEVKGTAEAELPQVLLANKPAKWDRIRIGMSERQVKKILGRPTATTMNFLEYGDAGGMFSNDPSAKSWVVFLKNGRVSQLRRPVAPGQ